jgi:L-2-hydroxyglutarate oxidase LhgO
MEKLDCVVIGAGVIGIAAARALALSGREVVILEKAEGIGTEASSRNSEVIHAGIYYRPGSLKASACVTGRQMLYSYCEEKGVNHQRTGKLVVAMGDEEMVKLAALKKQAEKNGVDDLAWLDSNEVQEMEPDLRCKGALFSPSTGIIDSHGLMTSLLSEAEDMGAMLILGTPVEGGSIQGDDIHLRIGGRDATTISAGSVVNCSGIHATSVAASITGLRKDEFPVTHLCKGNYFSLTGNHRFNHLIYPLPDQGGLGIHLTLDLAGRARFGPDVEWVDRIDYQVDMRRRESFVKAISKYWPEIETREIMQDYSGIRAKVSGPGDEDGDFIIHGPSDHGIDGLVNLFGIESPGLTASLAIAEEIRKILA